MRIEPVIPTPSAARGRDLQSGEVKLPVSKLVKFGDYLIEPQPFAKGAGWATHVKVWRDFGGHVSSAQLGSSEIAYTREEADKRCVEYAIRAIERGLELR